MSRMGCISVNSNMHGCVFKELATRLSMFVSLGEPCPA